MPGTPVATVGNSGGPHKAKVARQGSFTCASTQKRKRSDLPLAAIRIPHKAKMAKQGSFTCASTQKRKRSDLPLAAILPHKAKMARQGSFAALDPTKHACMTFMQIKLQQPMHMQHMRGNSNVSTPRFVCCAKANVQTLP